MLHFIIYLIFYTFRYRLGGIIGGNSMQGHDVFFDNENNRIGFAESNCDYGDAVSKDKKP